MIRGGVAISAACLCVLVAALGADARTSASPWAKLPNGSPLNSGEAALARTADGRLHVVYPRHNGTTEDIWSVVIAGNGQVGAATAVVQGWSRVENPDVVMAPDGTLRTFFGGIKSTDPTNTNDALNTASAPADGSSWTLQPGPVSGDANADVSPTAAAVTKDGQVVEATTSTFGLTVHYGLTPATPTVRVPGNCCYYDPGLAVSSSGQTVLGWYSNESTTVSGASAGPGMFLQELGPSGLVGARQLAPGSVSADGKSALSPGYRTAVTGRIGAPGVYFVYGVGYPTFTKVAVLRFGSPKPALVIAAFVAADNRSSNVAAAPAGRLWLFWKHGTAIVVTRTNKAATAIEPLRQITPPPGADTVWNLDGNGALGPLDLVANVTTSDTAFWYRRVLPRLSLHGSALGATNARFVVTDAGDPLAGARISVRGRTLTTNASGVASATLPLGPATATASRPGYIGASVRVNVR